MMGEIMCPPDRAPEERMMMELEQRIKACLGRERIVNNENLLTMEVRKCVVEMGGGLPSTELAEMLVSHLCFANNTPSLWKFLHHALSCGLIYPLHVLALLSSRIIPHRRSQPEAYRLYLELLGRCIFSVYPLSVEATKNKISKSIDAALRLSQTYSLQVLDFGHVIVVCYFNFVVDLVDSVLGDCGLPMSSKGGDHGHKQNGRSEQMTRRNTYMALEVLTKLTDSRKAVALLRLVHLNMTNKFEELLTKIQCLETHKLSLNLESFSQLISKLFASIRSAQVLQCELGKHQLLGSLMGNGSCKLDSWCDLNGSKFNCWVAFDMCMENAMDGKQLSVTSAVDILTETISTLQVFNGASWLETFLALWISALRLVQRERDPLEGPIPHLEPRLCILLSIVPLAIARVLNDKPTIYCSSHSEGMPPIHLNSDPEHGNCEPYSTSRRQGLIFSLQALGQYPSLLHPPASVVDASNAAAVKAAGFIMKTKYLKDGMNQAGQSQTAQTIVEAGGDIRHLIVEACIARNLIDTSAYFWPGYVSASVPLTDTSAVQRSPWSTLMGGSPLTPDLVNDLILVPAPSLVEIEKLYQIALCGEESDRVAAAKILCGASLRRGWNIQEHVVYIVVKLLSPPVPPNCIDPKNHLVEYLPMISSVLSGASSIDSVHILSLLGVLPEVAAALVPLCEEFGSLIPPPSHKLTAYDEHSIYMAFSTAFLFLMRLWKFYRPPREQCITGRGGAMGSELTLEYLFILRNSRIQSSCASVQSEKKFSTDIHGSVSTAPTYIDYYPRLRAWYSQNRSCIASTVSGLSNGNSVHQVGSAILTMLYGRLSGSLSKVSSTLPSTTSSGSPSTTSGDIGQRPLLPAWDALEAVPFVLEAILTAFSHGRLSSRDLTTGLRDLVDFLPASLVTIISYFSAEVTRGIWKLVPMNGIDWPSPVAMLTSIEDEMKEILAAVGVNIPTHSSGDSSPAMLPLPMAALVSLTITFKLDKSLEYIQAVAGPGLENCAAGCPWPSMPIIGSLWAKKVRRWHDYIVVSSSRSVFRHNHEAIGQLLRSCFTSFLGSFDNCSTTTHRGTNSLLGSFIASRDHHPPVAPGFLYLRSCHTLHHVQQMNHVIVDLVAEFSRKSALKWGQMGSSRLKSTGSSLTIAMSKVKEIATLGASLLCVAGGSLLVQELYQDTVPTWLLTGDLKKENDMNFMCQVLQGYAMAYFLVLSGAFIWGLGAKEHTWARSKRSRIFGTHMDFLAGVLGGNISFGCNPITWKAYVSCLVGLTVSCAPIWIGEVKQETLKTLANGLKGWNEYELALSLLERGGTSSMGSVVEMLLYSGLND